MDWLRKLYYTRRYGEPDAHLMLAIERAVRRIPFSERYQPWLLKRFDWLSTLELADCLEGVELLAQRFESNQRREQVIGTITKKNSTRLRLDHLERALADEPNPAQRQRFEALISETRSKLAVLEDEVEAVKQELRGLDCDLRTRTLAFYARCGSPPEEEPPKSEHATST